MELVQFIGVIALVLLFTEHFQPIQPAKDKVVDWLVGKIVRLGMKWSPAHHLLQVVKLLTCAKCLSFWTILVLTQDIFVAATAAIVAMVMNNLIKYPLNNGPLK
jgi:hypothetical protein